MDGPPDQPRAIVPISPEDQIPVAYNEQPVPTEPESGIVDPDWVVGYRPRRKAAWLRWVAALIQILTGVFIALIFYMIPLEGSTNPFANWKNPVIIFILICYIGKTLVDTLFYDHYQP